MTTLIQLLLNGIVESAFYLMVAVGFALIFSVTKTFHNAHGLVFTIAAYASYWFLAVLKLHPALAVLLTVPLTILAGMACELLLYRPMRRRGASSFIIMLSSFALLMLGANTLALVSSAQFQWVELGRIATQYEFLGIRINSVEVLIVATAAISVAGLLWFLKKTRLGRNIRAVSNNPLMADLVGIDSERVYLYVFALGSALAAPAGILALVYVGASPYMGWNAIFMAFVISIVGGVGSITGAVLGALTIGIVRNVAAIGVEADWLPAITFGLLLAFILLRPRGLLGAKTSF